MARTLLVLSGGHPYEEAPFAAFLESLGDWDITHHVHPEAEEQVAAGAADSADAMLFYDMPGYTFADGTVKTAPPSDAFKAALERRFASGRGAVMMHHAIAGWAEWPQWSEWLGGRFLYQPGPVRGATKLDSGYRHDVDYTAELVGEHPVLAGAPATFSVNDELYLGEVFEADVTPLIRARHDYVAENFYSAAHAVAGRMFDNSDWPHPPGSNLVAWTKPIGAAQMVYCQFGDGPHTYANPVVRQIIANALEWTARV
ncbi:ThuA domain-containing protein [Novosphingobium sp.]|uniref:ThuA domain-containing protein n=1 Tax=Novosphingobium sp. TaxID=1874826 RepID=UPI001D9046C8|nr:ThuA domain-containing protein [Novosphingobium sp.]MBX9664617.1 ThuA domain-containing protein [Novosphingobium sp.]